MAQDLSYEAMDREKADAQAAQQAQIEKQQIDAAQQAQAQSEKNPALQVATNNLANNITQQQQGLGPNPALSEYSRIAGEIANASRNQEEYSNNMIKAGQSGAIDPRTLLGDESILPQFRDALYNSMQQPKGLGTIQ